MAVFAQTNKSVLKLKFKNLIFVLIPVESWSTLTDFLEITQYRGIRFYLGAWGSDITMPCDVMTS